MTRLDLEAVGLGSTEFSAALEADWQAQHESLTAQLRGARVLVVGGAGTIGSACVRALLDFIPARIDVIDLDENGLARLAREIRGGHLGGLRTRLNFLPLDFAAWPALAYVEQNGPYDLVLNLAAIKHVRSEKNLHTLLHMIDTNVLKQRRFFEWICARAICARYFVVSTDKAADPVSFMGATKRLLEDVVLCRVRNATAAPLRSAARFANVAYSSGSLLESFVLRLQAGHPLAVPRDTRRYFISAHDAARICLLTPHVCPDGRIAIPKMTHAVHEIELSDIAADFLSAHGLRPVFVDSAQEAARLISGGRAADTYPVVLAPRDTSGEKESEVFVAAAETRGDLGLAALDMVVPREPDAKLLDEVLAFLAARVDGTVAASGIEEIDRAVRRIVPSFAHRDTGMMLDDRL